VGRSGTDDVLDCGNSGTALRLLAGVVAGIDGISVLTGDASLRSRPVDRVATPLRAMGAHLDARDGGRRPPLVVRGGRLTAITYDSPVPSAQVKSCVLLAGLAADGPTTVRSPLVSRDHTERLLGYLGVEVERSEEADGREVVRLTPGALRPRPIAVAGDPSSAAFWLVAAAAGAGEVRVPGVCANPTRLGVVAALTAMGGEVAVDAARRGGR
jgi:3-phosphoshikimate 1-carboxyvinyltransferase